MTRQRRHEFHIISTTFGWCFVGQEQELVECAGDPLDDLCHRQAWLMAASEIKSATPAHAGRQRNSPTLPERSKRERLERCCGNNFLTAGATGPSACGQAAVGGRGEGYEAAFPLIIRSGVLLDEVVIVEPLFDGSAMIAVVREPGPDAHMQGHDGRRSAPRVRGGAADLAFGVNQDNGEVNQTRGGQRCGRRRRRRETRA